MWRSVNPLLRYVASLIISATTHPHRPLSFVQTIILISLPTLCEHSPQGYHSCSGIQLCGRAYTAVIFTFTSRHLHDSNSTYCNDYFPRPIDFTARDLSLWVSKFAFRRMPDSVKLTSRVNSYVEKVSPLRILVLAKFGASLKATISHKGSTKLFHNGFLHHG